MTLWIKAPRRPEYASLGGAVLFFRGGDQKRFIMQPLAKRLPFVVAVGVVYTVKADNKGLVVKGYQTNALGGSAY